MNFYIKCVFLCLSYQVFSKFYIVQSTSRKEYKPCALDHEVHFNNVYRHFTFDGRRQYKPPKTLLEILIPYKGPKKGPKYNPSLGYEPYWPQGNWVYSLAPNKTTKGSTEELCGQNCPEVFKSYGTVCGRDRKNKYKTFESYCQLISEDCSQRSAWLIAYKGACQGDFKTYPTKAKLIPTRAAEYISNFEYQQTTELVLDDSFFNKFRTTTIKH